MMLWVIEFGVSPRCSYWRCKVQPFLPPCMPRPPLHHPRMHFHQATMHACYRQQARRRPARSCSAYLAALRTAPARLLWMLWLRLRLLYAAAAAGYAMAAAAARADGIMLVAQSTHGSPCCSVSCGGPSLRVPQSKLELACSFQSSGPPCTRRHASQRACNSLACKTFGERTQHAVSIVRGRMQ